MINGNGQVKEYEDGDLVFEGEYLNGKKWNGNGQEYDEYDEDYFRKYEYLFGQKYIKQQY